MMNRMIMWLLPHLLLVERRGSAELREKVVEELENAGLAELARLLRSCKIGDYGSPRLEVYRLRHHVIDLVDASDGEGQGSEQFLRSPEYLEGLRLVIRAVAARRADKALDYVTKALDIPVFRVVHVLAAFASFAFVARNGDEYRSLIIRLIRHAAELPLREVRGRLIDLYHVAGGRETLIDLVISGLVDLRREGRRWALRPTLGVVSARDMVKLGSEIVYEIPVLFVAHLPVTRFAKKTFEPIILSIHDYLISIVPDREALLFVLKTERDIYRRLTRHLMKTDDMIDKALKEWEEKFVTRSNTLMKRQLDRDIIRLLTDIMCLNNILQLGQHPPITPDEYGKIVFRTRPMPLLGLLDKPLTVRRIYAREMVCVERPYIMVAGMDALYAVAYGF